MGSTGKGTEEWTLQSRELGCHPLPHSLAVGISCVHINELQCQGDERRKGRSDVYGQDRTSKVEGCQEDQSKHLLS